MAIEIADLSTYYSAMTTVDLRELAVWPALCNRNWEAELQGQNKVVIQDPTYNTDPATRTRGADFTSTKKESSSDQLTLQVNNRNEQRNVLDYEDAEEAPIDWLNRIRMSQAIDMATANTNSVNTSVYAAMTGSTFSGAQDQTLGTATSDFIDNDAPYNGTGRGYGLIHDAIGRWDLYMQRANMRGTTIGGAVGETTIVMPPELFVGYRQWTVEQGYQWDALTSSVLSSGGVLTGERFVGSMFGIRFVTSNRYSEPVGNAMWRIHAFTTGCFTFAMKSPFVQILSPTTNQTGPYWDLKQIGRWAILEINPTFKSVYKIRVA